MTAPQTDRRYEREKDDRERERRERNEGYARAKEQIAQLEAELAEFQATSRELEREMELELEEAEQRQKGLEKKVNSLTADVSEWKQKYLDLQKESSNTQATLSKQVSTLQDTLKQANNRLREIEMANDDMERHERITKTSLHDLEQKYYSSLETIALLESEVANKDQYQVDLQRAKDELRETSEELSVAQCRIDQLESKLKDLSSQSQHSSPPSTTTRAGQRVPSYRVASASSAVSNVTVSASSPSSSTSPSLSSSTSKYGNLASGASVSRMTSSKSLRKIHGMLDQMRSLESRVASFKSSLPKSSRPGTPTMSPASSINNSSPSTGASTPSPSPATAPSSSNGVPGSAPGSGFAHHTLRRSPSVFDRNGFHSTSKTSLRPSASRRNLSISGTSFPEVIRERQSSSELRTPSGQLPKRSVLTSIEGSPAGSPSPSIRHQHRRSMLNLNPSNSVSSYVQTYDKMLRSTSRESSRDPSLRPQSVHALRSETQTFTRPGSAFSALNKRQSIGHGR
uniref:ARAD1C07568p n=1 Tax=Blastobotrys adeninivorans TaxID=409370 RepID=A0A060T5T0_BLAAD